MQRLPIIFILENNLWAESVPARLQSAVEDFSVKAQAYGMPGTTVDGNDAVAVYKATQEAIHRARQGDGPTLVECKTYRWYGHSEIDPAKYRTVEELEYWKSRDPIPAMERYLHERGFWADSWKQELLTRFDKEMDEAIEFAEKSPYPEPEEALDHVFSFSIRERELTHKTWAPQISRRR